MTEKQFATVVKKELNALSVSYQFIESRTTGTGIPDLYIQSNSKPFWVELKVRSKVTEEEATKDQMLVPISFPQWNWAYKNYVYGSKFEEYRCFTLMLIQGPGKETTVQLINTVKCTQRSGKMYVDRADRSAFLTVEAALRYMLFAGPCNV